MNARRAALEEGFSRHAAWLGAGLALVGLTVVLTWGAGQSTGKPQVFFTIEQSTNHMGGGVALSPDGTTLVYVAAGEPHSGLPNRLYAAGVGTGDKRPVLKDKDAGTGGGVFGAPAFSPDGSRIIFVASGGTYYYASDIYSVQLDGSGLTQLTHSKEIDPEQRPPDAGQAQYSQYFSVPQFSPDGSKILLAVDDTHTLKDYAAVMNLDGSSLNLLVKGKPLFWGADSQSFYYAGGSANIDKFDLSSSTSQPIQGLPTGVLDPYSFGPEGSTPLLLGKLPDRDWFVTVDPKTGKAGLVSVQHGAATFQTSLNVPLTEPTSQGPMSLVSLQWTPSGRVLLDYQGDDETVKVERFEVAQATY